MLRTGKREGDWHVARQAYTVPEGVETRLLISPDRGDRRLVQADVALCPNATLFVELHGALGVADLLGRLSFSLSRGSRLVLVPVVLGGGHVTLDISCALRGKGASIEMCGGYLTAPESDYDLNLTVRHLAPETDSRLHMRGVLERASRKTYKYTLDFVPGTSGSSGEESEHVVALSEDFSNATVPVLLVGEDDITASHGATLTAPDDAMIDYILSRGIGRKQAEDIVVRAQLADAMSRLSAAACSTLEAQIEDMLKHRRPTLRG